jgi:RNA polymerase sigma-70 factor (ECF subfamily)
MATTDESPDLESDRVAVLLAIAGDDGAFERLVRRHQSWLRAFLRRVCGNAAQADDLAQIAFLKAWKRIASLRNADTFKAWLRRIALNAAVDAVRGADPWGETLLHDEDIAAASSAMSVETVAERLDLESAMMKLSFAARTCVLLHLGEGMSHSEIAAETGMPLGTIKSHIARAMPLLRSWLQDWREA